MKTQKGKNLLRDVFLFAFCIVLCAAVCACSQTTPGEPAQNGTDDPKVPEATEDPGYAKIVGKWQAEGQNTVITFNSDGSADNGEDLAAEGYTMSYAFEKMLILSSEESDETTVSLFSIEGNALTLFFGPENEIVLTRTDAESGSGTPGTLTGEWRDSDGTTYKFTDNGVLELSSSEGRTITGSFSIRDILSILFYNSDGSLLDRDSGYYEFDGDSLLITTFDSQGEPLDSMRFNRIAE